jgi:ABC-type lipoprotein release transport system permease subunit
MLDLVVNVPSTFVGIMLRGCEPKMQRKERDNPNSEQVPALDKNGVPKFTVYLSVETKSSFGKKQFDEIEVTITSPRNPCEGIPNGSEVTIEGLIEGRMLIGKGKAVTTFLTADAIIPLKAAQLAQPVQPPRVAPAQPQQPTRVASGQ